MKCGLSRGVDYTNIIQIIADYGEMTQVNKIYWPNAGSTLCQHLRPLTNITPALSITCLCWACTQMTDLVKLDYFKAYYFSFKHFILNFNPLKLWIALVRHNIKWVKLLIMRPNMYFIPNNIPKNGNLFMLGGAWLYWSECGLIRSLYYHTPSTAVSIIMFSSSSYLVESILSLLAGNITDTE